MSVGLLPRGTALAVACVALRVALANLAPLTDCDEVYNYWEPLHFLLHGAGGDAAAAAAATTTTSMQTWEYAPQYALRTYAYLVPVAWLSRLYGLGLGMLPPGGRALLSALLSPPPGSAAAAAATAAATKPLQFRLLRSTFAALTAASELALHGALSSTASPTAADWYLLASLSSAGMFHASPAYLPSAHVMALVGASAASQLRGRDGQAIAYGLVAVLCTGWPFAAALFAPLGVRAVLGAARGPGGGASAAAGLLLRTALRAALLQLAVLLVDRAHYGRYVSPTLNIFVYNTSGGGDELYGVEPLSYYVKNLALNWNAVAVLGLLSLPLVLLSGGAQGAFSVSSSSSKSPSSSGIGWVLLPLYLWLAVVVPRPHKEERFLFPIYPILCAGAALVVDAAAGAGARWWSRGLRAPGKAAGTHRFLLLAVLLPIAVLSVSRSAALSDGYASPLLAYLQLHRRMLEGGNGGGGTVCVGGEWYRYPSAFHLPPGGQLRFVRSSFSGQLPQPFTSHGSRWESLAEQPGTFNDENRGGDDRYVTIDACDYVVELVDDVPDVFSAAAGTGPECVEYMRDSGGSQRWTELVRYPFVDVAHTPALHRILYVPWLRGGAVAYKSYAIYERT